jgi:hypothetical protein
MKIGVVIQGPVISFGRNFDSFESRKFDCIENINLLYREAKNAKCEVRVARDIRKPWRRSYFKVCEYFYI